MAKNVQITVVRPELEEHIIRAIPLIDDFLDKILAIVQLKADWSLVCFATGVTLNVQVHGLFLIVGMLGSCRVECPGFAPPQGPG